ncbi:hypothetical protein RA19_13655 [Leisingera sp. ANG-M1]|nr:hypothetical protein RA19_13655 [Leisingera sp. ANG-M1]
MNPSLADRDPGFLLGDGRQVQMAVGALVEQVACRIHLMQTLGNHHHPALGRVVKPGQEGAFDELLRPCQLGLGVGVRRLHQVIDDDVVSPMPGHGTADGNGLAAAPFGGLNLVLGVAFLCQARSGKQFLVPGGGHHLAGCLGMQAGEVQAIAGHDDLGVRVMTQQIGHKRHRHRDRLEMAGRHVDDQARVLSGLDIVQLVTHRFDMPGGHK